MTTPETTVLVVDDIDENLLVMQALLRRPGLRLITARSGADALELLLREERVALALLDVQMPFMDGFELAELMRGTERTRHIPIVFVTAGTRDAIRQFRGYEAGAVDFLYKPVEPHLLRSKVEVFVRLHEERQRAERQLAELRETVALNERLVAVLGHDLRAPLAALVNGAELLRRLPDMPEAGRETAGRMRASADRMSRMIAQLLDHARGREGRLPLRRVPVDLGRVADAIVQELVAGGHAAGRITTRRDGALDGMLDADRIGQVLSNLLGNALHHGDPGQPVQLVLDGTDPARLRLSVRNAGTLPAARRQAVFQAFGARGGGEGLGLGLHIVDQCVQAHGGTVRAVCDDTHTRFEVDLPRV